MSRILSAKLRSLALITSVTAAAAVTIMGAVSAHAEFPDQPITMIVPYGAGGGTDLTGRVLAREAEEYLDQPIAVINRAGASGTIGATEAANAKPDGYTLFFAPSDPMVTKPHQIDVPYSLDDFRGIVGVSYAPSSIAVNTDSPWETLEDLLAEKDTGRVIDRGHSGAGGIHHTLLEIFFQETGLQFRDVPFSGGADAITALRGGHVDLIGGTPGAMVPSIEAGEIRILALSAPERIDLFPDTPTFKDMGYDIVATVEWFLLAPKDTPDEIVELLEDVFTKAANSDEFQEFSDSRKQQKYVRTGDEIMDKLNGDFAFFGEIIKEQ